jgi:hypothetical protein
MFALKYREVKAMQLNAAERLSMAAPAYCGSSGNSQDVLSIIFRYDFSIENKSDDIERTRI